MNREDFWGKYGGIVLIRIRNFSFTLKDAGKNKWRGSVNVSGNGNENGVIYI